MIKIRKVSPIPSVLVGLWFAWTILLSPLFLEDVLNALNMEISPVLGVAIWIAVSLSTFFGYWYAKGDVRTGSRTLFRFTLIGLTTVTAWGIVFYIGSVYLEFGMPGFVVIAAAPAAIIAVYLLISSASDGEDFFRNFLGIVAGIALILWVWFCWWFFVDYVEWPKFIARLSGAICLLGGWLLVHIIWDRLQL